MYNSILLRENISGFLISFTIIVIGLIMQLIRHTVAKGSYIPGNLSLGFAATLIGAWSLNETVLPLMLIDNSVIVNALDYSLVLFAPYPLCIFF